MFNNSIYFFSLDKKFYNKQGYVKALATMCYKAKKLFGAAAVEL